jgi:hypothetical protein
MRVQVKSRQPLVRLESPAVRDQISKAVHEVKRIERLEPLYFGDSAFY